MNEFAGVKKKRKERTIYLWLLDPRTEDE